MQKKYTHDSYHMLWDLKCMQKEEKYAEIKCKKTEKFYVNFIVF